MSDWPCLIFVPSHGLEDFPTDLGEEAAASLLNMFAVAWHPRVIKAAQRQPQWHRADLPPEPQPGQIAFVSRPCENWLAGGWVGLARGRGATVFEHRPTRDEILQDIRAAWPDAAEISSEIIADFLALGSCWLQLELLARQMHQLSAIEENQAFETRLLAAAEAAVARDDETARVHLRFLFEKLLEGRERFFPGEMLLCDLCLVETELFAGSTELRAAFARQVASPHPWNLLITGAGLRYLAEHQPAELAILRQQIAAGVVGLVGGDDREQATALIGPEQELSSLEQGLDTFEELLGQRPRVWGRRRFGLNPVLPGWLHSLGFAGALHLVLDDGLYPDAEYSQFQWQGCDNSSVTAFSRIPLAADGAGSCLRFASRIAESMNHDPVAAVAWARWPEVLGPWLGDFQRMSNYFPVLGRFAHFDEFLCSTSTSRHFVRYKAAEYVPPYLIQAVARREASPISQQSDDNRDFIRREAASRAAELARLVLGDRFEAIESTSTTNVTLPDSSAAPSAEATTPHSTEPQAFEPQSIGQATFGCPESLVRSLTGHGIGSAGLLIVNPLAHDRRTCTPIPPELHVPNGAIPSGTGLLLQAVDSDPAASPEATASGPAAIRQWAVINVPACGFVWLPAQAAEPLKPSPTSAGSLPTTLTTNPDDSRRRGLFGLLPGRRETRLPADSASATTSAVRSTPSHPMLLSPGVIQNEFLEIRINPETGGLGELHGRGRRGNRLSQQLVRRFSRLRKIPADDPEQPATESYYSEMRCHHVTHRAVADGIVELVSTGDIWDQLNQKSLARFEQRLRLIRGCPWLEIDVQLSDLELIDGDPWTQYFGARFAWNDSIAAVSRSVLGTIQGFVGERFEAPEFIEIASPGERITILGDGLPYHRKTAPRMLDTLLVVAGERARHFRWRITLDAPHPLEAAAAAAWPLAVSGTAASPPGSAASTGAGSANPALASGWLIHLDARSVKLLDVAAITAGSTTHVDTPGNSLPAANLAAEMSATDVDQAAAAPDTHKEPSSTELDPLQIDAVATQFRGPGVKLRLQETEGAAVRCGVRLFRSPARARKTDLLGRTLVELIPEGDLITVDLSPFEVCDLDCRWE